MKRSNLVRRYADILDMCDGISINPNSCVKQFGCTLVHYPAFTGNLDAYEFALAIVEDKPVFVGDVLYIQPQFSIIESKIEVDKIIKDIVHSKNMQSAHISNVTWNPPKKDEYAELKRAQSKGSKIAWQTGVGVWSIQGHISDELFAQHPVDRWKVVEDDEVEIVHYYKWEDTKIRVTKSGLDGKITAEIVS